MRRRIRIYVAGSADSILTDVALATLIKNESVEVVGVAFAPMRLDELEAARPDILLSAAHRFMIPARLTTVARIAALGIHPSKLPRNRGSYPLWWALRRGYSDTALTLFHLVDQVDAGPIVDQRVVPIHRDDTFRTLYERVAEEVAPALDRLVSIVVELGEVPKGHPQDPTRAIVVRTPHRWQRAIMRVYWQVRRWSYGLATSLSSRGRSRGANKSDQSPD